MPLASPPAIIYAPLEDQLANAGDTAGNQYFADVAVLSDGTYVVVWETPVGGGGGPRVVGRRFAPDGASPIFEIADAAGTLFAAPSVASLADGGFVVVWQSMQNLSTDITVHAQRFDVSGAAVGERVLLATSASLSEYSFKVADVAGLTGGGFVAVWGEPGQDGSGSGVYGQRFDASGTSQGEPFRINSFTNGDQVHPTIAALADGGFVVSWTSFGQDGSGAGAYGQRYDSLGTPQGPEFRANVSTAGLQGLTDVAPLSGGGFVIVWTDQFGEATSDVFGRRYSASGVAQGSEFRINSAIEGGQAAAQVTGTADGGFVVSWGSSDSGNDVYAQRYASSGTPVGSQFLLSRSPDDDAHRAALAGHPNGGFVVVTDYADRDGDGFGVYRNFFLPSPNGQLSALSDHGAGSSGNDLILGLAGNDLLEGFGGDDRLDGGDGDDTLLGSAGNDFLIGGAGGDSMTGGAGNDTFSVENIGDGVFEDAGGGRDHVLSSIGFTLGDNVENLTLIGTAAIDGFGNALANLIIGNVAANRLDGGLAADRMQGGDGDDTYVVDNIRDKVIESGNAGNDLVEASVNFALPSNFENLTLTGGLDIDGTGNSLANTITGNAGANQLVGGGGADIMRGGAGNDIYYVDHAADQAVENESEGIDTVRTKVSFTLGANVENLVLIRTDAINGTGNGLANVLTGNAGANVLNGGAGADRMKGGAGNDTYIVDNAGDQVEENASEGTDTVQSSLTFTLGSHVEHLTLTGGSAINGTGNTLANTITGNGAANLLVGGLGNDTLVGNGGADTLRGGAGLDTLSGGAAADNFTFDTALSAANLDHVTDFVSGTDEIVLENAVFTGLAAGPLNANAFRLGAAAQDADDRILYDTATGRLYFDADGNGAGAAVHFATLDNLPATLAASDFTAI